MYYNKKRNNKWQLTVCSLQCIFCFFYLFLNSFLGCRICHILLKCNFKSLNLNLNTRHIVENFDMFITRSKHDVTTSREDDLRKRLCMRVHNSPSTIPSKNRIKCKSLLMKKHYNLSIRRQRNVTSMTWVPRIRSTDNHRRILSFGILYGSVI